jgi:hypothetical protein
MVDSTHFNITMNLSEIIYYTGFCFIAALTLALNVMWWGEMLNLIAETFPPYRKRNRIRKQLNSPCEFKQ